MTISYERGIYTLNKFNALGEEILALKEAINSPYPDIVLKSLVQTANQLLETEFIDANLHYLLTEPNLSYTDFVHHCAENEQLLKTQEELLQDYDKKRLALVEELNHELDDYELSSENYLDKECIMLVKTYSFGATEAKEYFGLTDTDCEPLMRRKGFIEKFAALRLKKILTDFLAEELWLIDLFNLSLTPVFFDDASKVYAIELLFEISVEALEERPNSLFAQPVREVLEKAQQYLDERLRP